MTEIFLERYPALLTRYFIKFMIESISILFVIVRCGVYCFEFYKSMNTKGLICESLDLSKSVTNYIYSLLCNVRSYN